jgi:hypothetical protein
MHRSTIVLPLAIYDWKTTGTLACVCVVALYIARRALGNRTSYPLPPGPPGLPWVGNVIGIDSGAPWVTYAEWAKTYGMFSVPRHQLKLRPVQAT